jgi:hypothetical protein
MQRNKIRYCWKFAPIFSYRLHIQVNSRQGAEYYKKLEQLIICCTVEFLISRLHDISLQFLSRHNQELIFKGIVYQDSVPN